MGQVLLVDDTAFIRMSLTSILTEAGHEVVGEANDGLEAIQQYKKLMPDLVIMDITMPVMNGIESLKEIITFDSDAQIIMCSAMNQQKVVVEAIESGAKDFLVKPFNENCVLETLNRVLHINHNSFKSN
ncbi:response regulator [Virgibacillus halodenitrificans]|jgi:two-component system, chemotaxis family, chemotaxis protein CheY|uniref:Response regulator n=1 Tax=Virgibacillus halodenitrificans TaxID=1482 RepID=A0AAC9NL96_VIRHA|nr:response regulator [Virgibacillus halodenitrificans]APC48534.1 two-component system response regulator [Virgibacillus halodenitrificans]MBD1224283.1 response regulator [Virgibacillus halodenitrificans]MCG1028408.1 response regulator [Virgibacillus halodenitrificans]MCJ0931110.1 response regulator [Virgibacillus halodenitrificans]MEC2160942.1 response regulator [Virgibacillus halodenitrificans]